MIPAYIGIKEAFEMAVKSRLPLGDGPDTLPSEETDARTMFQGSLRRCREASQKGQKDFCVFSLLGRSPAKANMPSRALLHEEQLKFEELLGQAGFTCKWRQFDLRTDGTCRWALMMDVPKPE